MNISKSQSCEKGRTRRCSPRNLAKVGSLDLDQTRFDGANLLRRRLKDAGIVADYSPTPSGRPALQLSGERRGSGGRSADCRPR